MRKTDNIMAFTHTHPNRGGNQESFSGTDAKFVKNSGIPYFVRTPRNDIRFLSVRRASGISPLDWRKPVRGNSICRSSVDCSGL